MDNSKLAHPAKRLLERVTVFPFTIHPFHFAGLHRTIKCGSHTGTEKTVPGASAS